ncbi:Ycf66 family protein [Baaleninema simplex]|uniref:Ycf66 family protein n=1 Tax=Baaleninema simplex TaxID=2862350 RepID=UPI000344A5B9|nr:Ycf66 family protein [Baaleninema simplex]
MLAYLLAVAVGLGSFILFMAAFFFPEVYRKGDFVWSGVGFFYALVLWFCAGRFTGAVLLGQTASVTLIGWLGWQTLRLRREVTPRDRQTPTDALEEKASELLSRETPPATTPQAEEPGETESPSAETKEAAEEAIAMPEAPDATETPESTIAEAEDTTPEAPSEGATAKDEDVLEGEDTAKPEVKTPEPTALSASQAKPGLFGRIGSLFSRVKPQPSRSPVSQPSSEKPQVESTEEPFETDTGDETPQETFLQDRLESETSAADSSETEPVTEDEVKADSTVEEGIEDEESQDTSEIDRSPEAVSEPEDTVEASVEDVSEVERPDAAEVSDAGADTAESKTAEIPEAEDMTDESDDIEVRESEESTDRDDEEDSPKPEK